MLCLALNVISDYLFINAETLSLNLTIVDKPLLIPRC
jgi:hypothetical protein